MVRMAEKSDMPAVRALWQARFGDDDAFCDFFFTHRASPETTVVYDEGGKISSALHILPDLVRIRTQAVRAAMLCGVATDKAFEGQGRMGACLRYAMRALARTDCALLVQKPVDFAIYRNFGFSPVSDSLYFTLTSPDPAAFLPEYSVYESYEADKAAELCRGIYPAFSADYSTIGLRDAQKQTIKCMDYFAEPFSRLFSAGSIYAFVEPESDTLYLRECAWKDKHAKQALPALLSSILRLTQAKKLEGRLPADCARLLRGEIHPCGAAACENLSLLLASAFGDPEFCVLVSDPVIPENCGVWDLSGVRTDREPDLALDSAGLVQFVCGYRSIKALADEGNAKILHEPRASLLDARYPVQNCFTWDEY